MGDISIALQSHDLAWVSAHHSHLAVGEKAGMYFEARQPSPWSEVETLTRLLG